MGITLQRPVPATTTPRMVAPQHVVRVDTLHVPTALREHVHTLLQALRGPAVMGHWFTAGTFYPGGHPRTLTARVTRAHGRSEVQYGYQVITPPTSLLECPQCQDVRPDVPRAQGGVQIGDRCVWADSDCQGRYRIAR